jgi:hypothetical protein
MTMKDAIKKNRPQPIDIVAPLHFLLNCSDVDLGSFQNTKLNEARNARTKLHEDLDQMFDLLTQAALANFFRAYGRERILKALEETPDPIAEAKARIKEMGHTPEDLVPLLSLPPGQAHRTAAVTYQNRNIEDGKCCVCPNPLVRNSVRYCETHLAACRDRARVRAKKLNKPPHGRAPGTVAALAEGRKKPKGGMNL